MLEIKNVEVYGIKRAHITSGFPMTVNEPEDLSDKQTTDQDRKRLCRLGSCKPGTGHDVSLTSIIVQYDMKAPLYFMKQFQRYHYFQINSSQSTMHCGQKMNIQKSCNEYTDVRIINVVQDLQEEYNADPTPRKFMVLISNIPSGFQNWLSVTTNYLQLKTVHIQRRHHKLEDWQIFCDWIETLPMFEEICQTKKD